MPLRPPARAPDGSARDVAGAAVVRLPREGAQRSGAVDATVGQVRCDHARGRHSALNPLHERTQTIERVGARTAAAMADTTQQIQPRKRIHRVASTQRVDHAEKVLAGALGCDERVGEAVVDDQLAAVLLERREIRIERVQDVAEQHPCRGQVGVNVERSPIPHRILLDHVAVDRFADAERRRSSGHDGPQCLTARHEARVDRLPRAVDRALIQLAQCLHPCRAQARGPLQRGQIELHHGRVADHAVGGAISRVPSCQHRLMDSHKLRGRQVRIWIGQRRARIPQLGNV